MCIKTFGAGKLLGDTEGYGRPLAQRPRGKPARCARGPGQGRDLVGPELSGLPFVES